MLAVPGTLSSMAIKCEQMSVFVQEGFADVDWVFQNHGRKGYLAVLVMGHAGRHAVSTPLENGMIRHREFLDRLFEREQRGGFELIPNLWR